MDHELLKAFVAVAEQRSFTRAAGALNRTQSAVSMQVRRLEERLAATLFRRTTAKVELTAAGESLLTDARRLLALSEEAVERLAAHQTEGSVRLGVMDDFGTIVLPPLLARFSRLYPQILIEMETGLTARMPDRLGVDFDLVIAMYPPGRGGGTLLRRQRAVWAGSRTEAVESLDPLPLALYPKGCLFREWATQALNRSHRTWRLAFVCHSLSAVAAIVAQGLAVTIVKEDMVPPDLRVVSEEDGMPPLPTADIRLHQAVELTNAAALMADFLIETSMGAK